MSSFTTVGVDGAVGPSASPTLCKECRDIGIINGMSVAKYLLGVEDSARKGQRWCC